MEISLQAEEEHKLVFALCESCYWSASMLEIAESSCFHSCPVCFGKNMAFIPLASDESYMYQLSEKRDLELYFSTRSRPY